MSDSTKTLHIKGFFSPVEFEAGSLLLDVLNANKVSIDQSCGGNGSCATCRVFILSGLGNCSSKSEIETERAHERGFAAHERLSCQTHVYGDLEIEILSAVEL